MQEMSDGRDENLCESEERSVVEVTDEPLDAYHQEIIDNSKPLSERDATIAMMKARGMSYREIGEEVALGKSRVAAICQRDDVRTVIEQEQKRLVSLVPSAVENYKAWIMEGSITKDKDMRDISFKASTKVLESVGILAGNSSVMVQNVYNDNKQIISPVIVQLLGEFTKKLNDFDDVVDAEYEET